MDYKNQASPEQLAQQKQDALYKQMQDSVQQVQMMQKEISTQQGAHPGTILTTPDSFEQQAGVTPPAYEGTRDPATGKLLDQYQLDPYSGQAEQALKQQAFSTGLSPQAQNLLDSQHLAQQDAMGNARQQQMTQQDQAQSQLARSGGLTGGGAALLARQGARDSLNAQQGIARQGLDQSLGIQQQDILNKNQMLGQFANMENSAQQGNITSAQQDIQNKAMFDANRYNQQMQAWGAKQSADATRDAGGGGKK